MELIICDPFLTTTINYLTFNDLYHLSQVNKHCHQIANPANRLVNLIYGKMKELFSPNYRTVRNLFDRSDILITGLFIGEIFRNRLMTNFFASHLYVLSNENNIEINKVFDLYPTLEKRHIGDKNGSIFNLFVGNGESINFAIDHKKFKDLPEYQKQTSYIIEDDQFILIDYQKLLRSIYSTN